MKLSLVLYVIVIALAFLQVSFAQSGDGDVIDEGDGKTDSGSNPADDSVCPNNNKVFQTCKSRQESTLGACANDAWQCRCDGYRDLQNCYRGCEPPQTGTIENLEPPRQDACRRAAEEAAKSTPSGAKKTTTTEEQPTETDEPDNKSGAESADANDTNTTATAPPDEKSAAIKIHPTVFSAFLVVMAAALF